MKIEEKKEPNPTTYEYLIGMIEGCMPNDNDVVTTEKLLDKLIKEYAQQHTLVREKVIDVEIEDIYRRIRGPIHYTTNKDTGVVIHGIARATKDIYDFICSLPVKQQEKSEAKRLHDEYWSKVRTIYDKPHQQEGALKEHKGQRLFVECEEETELHLIQCYPNDSNGTFKGWLKPYTPQQWIVTKEYILDIIITKISSLYTSSGRIFNEELTQKEIFDMYDRLAIRIKELLTNKEKQI